MNCNHLHELLDDYIDGELEPADAKQVRLHLEGCDSCNDEYQATLQMLEQARDLSLDQEPSRELWEGIRDRIGPPEAGSGSSRRVWVLVAAAAVLVLAVVLGPGLLEPDRSPQDDNLAAGSPVQPVSYQEADDRFSEVREQLLAGLDHGDDRLDPETVRVVRKSLKVMDDAAAEIRKALATDPGNSGLRRMLLSSYRHQAKLLTRVREYPEPM